MARGILLEAPGRDARGDGASLGAAGGERTRAGSRYTRGLVLSWAMDADIPSPVIAHAQQQLMQFRDLDWPAAKAVALLRNQFGGHPVRTKSDTPPRT